MAPPDDPVHEISDGEQDAGAKSLQKVNQLKALRTSTKGSISRMKNLIAKKGISLSSEELNCRLCMLDDYFKKIISVQDEIDKLSPSADIAGNEAMTAEIEDIYVATKSKIMSLLSKRQHTVADVSMMNSTASFPAVPRVRREVKLPKFEGKYSEFPKFIALFNKLIHQDETFDNCERFF